MIHALGDIPVTARMKFKLIDSDKRNNKSLFGHHPGKVTENRKEEPSKSFKLIFSGYKST